MRSAGAGGGAEVDISGCWCWCRRPKTMGHQQRALIIQFCKKNRTKRKTEREKGREKAHKKNAKTQSSSFVWEGGRGHGGWMVHIMFYVHMESSLEKPGENENELCFSSLSFSFFLSSFYLVLLLFYSSLFSYFPSRIENFFAVSLLRKSGSTTAPICQMQEDCPRSRPGACLPSNPLWPI